MSLRAGLVALSLAVVACDRPRASQLDCERIVARITELELAEMGFKDPALAARKKAEMVARHRAEMGGCVGKPLSAEGRRCLDEARSGEELIHRCLR